MQYSIIKTAGFSDPSWQVDEERVMQAVTQRPAPSSDSVEEEQALLKANFDLKTSSSAENAQVRTQLQHKFRQKLEEIVADRLVVVVVTGGAFFLLGIHLSITMIFFFFFKHDLKAVNQMLSVGELTWSEVVMWNNRGMFHWMKLVIAFILRLNMTLPFTGACCEQ